MSTDFQDTVNDEHHYIIILTNTLATILSIYLYNIIILNIRGQ